MNSCKATQLLVMFEQVSINIIIIHVCMLCKLNCIFERSCMVLAHRLVKF